MRPGILRFAVIALLGASACEGDEPAPAEPSPAPITVPSGMPVTERLQIEEDEDEPNTFVVDDDALLQAALLALSGKLPVVRSSEGRLRVQAAPPGSILARAGLKAADQIVTIAGESTEEDEALLHAYQTLRELRRFVLVVDRNGERVRLTYRVTGLSRARRRPRRRPRAGREDSPLPLATPTTSASSLPRPPARGRFARFVPGAVKKVGPGRYAVSRKGLDALVHDPRGLSRSVRMVPGVRDGEAVGVKLYGIRRGSWLDELGFQNGDLILRVNGLDVPDPAAALEAYGKAKDATSYRVELERRGHSVTVIFDMVP